MSSEVARGAPAVESAESERAAVFRRLAEAHLDDSYRLACAILHTQDGAEDAVHDAIITGWGKWPSLRDPDRFDAWFRRIVVNTCRDRLRRVSRLESVALQLDGSLIAPDAAAGVHDRVLIEQALVTLRPDDRIVLALRYYRDLRIDDIASVLEIPPGTATSRLRAAHERLRDVLRRGTSEGLDR